MNVFSPGRCSSRYAPNAMALKMGPCSPDSTSVLTVPTGNTAGDSPAPKFFQGNRVSKSVVQFDRARNWLVSAEVALSVSLLLGAALLIQSLYRLRHRREPARRSRACRRRNLRGQNRGDERRQRRLNE